ncbi:hypothetical protein [Serratia fonticola]|uniref:hypothetical protein n=1 Tax=Serratia fonticola TaxID=47917 RepID=UPI000E0E6A1D|nr:hypothetical protein [Serratia fonticola]RDL15617.1 hypothetical protein DFO62_12327 [Serratia fonticola]
MNTAKPLSTQTVDSKLAREVIGRLKSALKNYPCVSVIESFRHAFHDTYHVQGQQSGYTDLLTAMLGVERLDEIAPLALVVDEGLSWSEVLERRKDQAERLVGFFKRHAAETGFLVPENILTQCLHLVELVQPLAIAQDKLAANFHYIAQVKAEGRLADVFHDVYRELVNNDAPEQKHVYQAIALHHLADEESLPASIRTSGAWEMLVLEVGTVATDWINSEEPVKIWRGIMALSGIHQLGEIYAGHQLAQSLFFKADAPRIDKQLALEVIELTFEQYLQRRPYGPVFACANSEPDLYCNYNTIVGEGIRNSDEPAEIDRLTRNLVTVQLEAAEKWIEGFAACVLCILTPDFTPLHGVDPENERLHALRRKISLFPDTEAWCQEQAGSPRVKSLQSRFY